MTLALLAASTLASTLLAAGAPAKAAAKIAPADRTCTTAPATAAYRRGFEAQADLRTEAALAAWKDCLAKEPDCVPCLYESGWTHWSRSEWEETVAAWDRVLVLDSRHEEARAWIQQARENEERGGSLNLAVPIGTTSTTGAISFELTARFQNYDSRPDHPRDRYDADVHSPKSVRISPDGKKVWVNSLAGARTVVYDAKTLAKLKVIEHRFGAAEAPLFAGNPGPFGWKFLTRGPTGYANRFKGLPVESEITHKGRFLWIPYYRRDWDRAATSPSAIAVIDAATDTILRVLPTGPIPKYVVASPDGKTVAVVHWGDNTIALVDASSPDPAKFRHTGTLVVEKALPMAKLGTVNRDKVCGFCIRGAVFTPDSKTLLVARMGGGGIAGFDVATRRYLGTVDGMKPTPRHLALSPDGTTLYLSSNVSGYVARIPVADVTAALAGAKGGHVTLETFEDVYVGGGARTLAVSPDGRFLFVAIQSSADLVAVDAKTLKLAGRIRADAYPVGLAVSPDGGTIWVTSQGRAGIGGNSVCVFRVTEKKGAVIPIAAPSPAAAAAGGDEE